MIQKLFIFTTFFQEIISNGPENVITLRYISNNYYNNSNDTSFDISDNITNARFFMESSTMQDTTNVNDLISIVAIPASNYYQAGVSMQLFDNAFLTNRDIDSIVYAKGPDLEVYEVFVDAHNNSFENNDVSISVFDLRNAQLYFSNSSIVDHNRIISATVTEILAENIETTNCTMLYLNNSRNNSVFGSMIFIQYSEFYDSDNAFEMYTQIEDELDFENCIFNDASMNTYVGSEHNDLSKIKAENQMEFRHCEFTSYSDRRALYVSNSLYEQDWFKNISMSNIVIQNSDNNKDDELSALLGFYDTNFNEQRKAYLTIDNITIRDCSDVIAIVEDHSENNNHKNQLSDVLFRNFSIYDDERAVLHHSYHRKARAYITWQNINWTSNVQDTSELSSSTAMIVVKESGVYCKNSDFVDLTIMRQQVVQFIL